MKKVFISFAVLALLGTGAAVYAHGPGWGGAYPCPGYNSDAPMMGPGYGGPVMGGRGSYDQKYLDETADLRKELNTKKFEYFEAIRNPKTAPETVAKLEKEIGELQGTLNAKAPQGTNRGYNMPCWQ